MVRDKNMTNKEIKKDKASVLAVTMIILGLVLSIALSASLVSILGNKASVSSNKSNLAYSRADSGIEDVLLRIKNADPDIDTVANIDTDGNCDGIVNGTNFKVELKDEAGILVSGDCSTKVSEIRSIKSTGIADNNQRSIEVAIAAEESVVSYGGSYLRCDVIFSGGCPYGTCMVKNLVTNDCSCPNEYTAQQTSYGQVFHYNQWDSTYVGYSCEKLN